MVTQFIVPLDVVAERNYLVQRVQEIIPEWTPLVDGRGSPLFYGLETQAIYAKDLVDKLNEGGRQTLLDEAEGEYLDAIGEFISGTKRNPGEPDAHYRERIPLAQAAYASGTPDYIEDEAKQADFVFSVSNDQEPGVDKANVWILAKDASGLPIPPTTQQISTVQTHMRGSDVQEGWIVYTVQPGEVQKFVVEAVITIDGDQGIIDLQIKEELNFYLNTVLRLNREVNLAGLLDGLVSYRFPHEVLNATANPTETGGQAYPLPAELHLAYQGEIGELIYHLKYEPTFGFNYRLVEARYDLTIPGSGFDNQFITDHIDLPEYLRGGIAPISYIIEGGSGASRENPLVPFRTDGGSEGYIVIGPESDSDTTPATRIRYRASNESGGSRKADITNFEGTYRYYAVDSDGRRSAPILLTISGKIGLYFAPGDIIADQSIFRGSVLFIQLPDARGTNGAITYEFSGGLPGGVSYNQGNKRISGRPNNTGTWTITYTASAEGFAPAVMTFTITVR